MLGKLFSPVSNNPEHSFFFTGKKLKMNRIFCKLGNSFPGIGGTRFISFEDRHWHNDCFICAGCKASLVGRGFITDGEDIICPECAKLKLM